MAPEQSSTKRIGRKLTKKRRPQRHSSLQYPESLKEGEDVHEDVTATKGNPSQNLNQSVFSMIAAAGSKVDFHARFEDGSSDSEVDDPSKATHNVLAQADLQHEVMVENPKLGKKHQHLSSQRPARALPRLNLRTIKERNYMSQSNHGDSNKLLSPTLSPTGVTPRDAPVMSMMLQAQAQLGSSTGDLDPPKEATDISKQCVNQTGLSDLVIRLKEIFGFEKPEEVISGNLVKRKIIKR